MYMIIYTEKVLFQRFECSTGTCIQIRVNHVHLSGSDVMKWNALGTNTQMFGQYWVPGQFGHPGIGVGSCIEIRQMRRSQEMKPILHQRFIIVAVAQGGDPVAGVEDTDTQGTQTLGHMAVFRGSAGRRCARRMIIEIRHQSHFLTNVRMSFELHW